MALALVPHRAWRALADAACDAFTDRAHATHKAALYLPSPTFLHSFASVFNPGQVDFTPTGRAARTDGVAARVDVGVDASVPDLVLFPCPERRQWRGCS